MTLMHEIIFPTLIIKINKLSRDDNFSNNRVIYI